MDTVQRFLEALEAGDLEAVAGTLAPGVVFRSPITNSARFEGRDRVVELYRAVLSTLTEIDGRVLATAGDVHVCTGTAVAGGRRFEDTLLVRVDTAGQIAELRMFVRDLPALTALAAAIGPPIARPHGRWRAVVVAMLARPLAWVTRVGDPLVARIARL